MTTRRIPKIWWFFGFILLINLLQSAFTPLIYDESYYWYYAQNLAWGYFDHPPMVALFIWLGQLLFDGELGVRFVGVILGTLNLALLWQLGTKNSPKNEALFILLSLSMVLFHAYGFLTLPDTALLFFITVFLWVYNRFLKEESNVNTILLGFSMAALVYSKYHGVLIILGVLFSNVQLLKSAKAWFAVALSIALFVPHILWLQETDWVSIQFHLFDRPNRPYRFSEFTLGYFLNVVANFGVMFWVFFIAFFRFKASSKFSKALVGIILTVLLVFFLSSFQRRTQAQWMVAICAPMLLITYQYYAERKPMNRGVLWSGFLGLGLLALARIWLIYLPLFPFFRYETHDAKVWVPLLANEVGNKPVVFENSYRRASMFAFYKGNKTYSYNAINFRENQYDIDLSEKSIRGMEVVFFTPHANDGEIAISMPDGSTHYGWIIKNYQPLRRLRFTFPKQQSINFDKPFKANLYNPYPFRVYLDSLKFWGGLTNAYKKVLDTVPLQPVEVSKLEGLNPNQTIELQFKLPSKGALNWTPSYLKLGIEEKGLRIGINSNNIAISE